MMKTLGAMLVSAAVAAGISLAMAGMEKEQLEKLQANVKKDKEILEEVAMHLRSMRDTWKEVMRQCKEK